MRRRTAVPVYRENLYSVANSKDPHPHYRRLRELGPVVWLPKHRVYAITRYAGCKSVLLDAKTFISGDGVGLNPIVNRLGRDTTLNSDGEDHSRRRKLVAPRMTPRALQTMRQQIEEMADSVVDEALSRGDIDGVADLARALPLGVVPDLVGWPEDQREHLLRWAAATFDSLGPLNATSLRTMTSSLGMMRFAKKIARSGNVLPDSLGEDALRAAGAGTISDKEGVALMIDYLAPSLDTTISGIASAVHLLATHPDQWEALRADPSLVPNAANEALRFEAPIRAFTRTSSTTSRSTAPPSPAEPGCWCSTPQPTATTWSGRTRMLSTSTAMLPRSWRSAAVRTPAQARAWRGSRPKPSCRRWSPRSRASNRLAIPSGFATT